MKLGSLFDGSGGFPLSGVFCGIEPVWAAEIEPYPIAVTKSRFPNMRHLGDISKVNGANIEPVDIITFGSPCQDMSVAGKRAGLKHEDNGDDETTRSGLFMEAVRIIKEMRGATNGEYPRFAVWENVPGAFSSNKGEDFRLVLEELIKITEPNAVMPEVPKKGWAYADSFSGDGWSLAYRVFDAQYWGVPQRRRRIYLVADFRGECAGEILFEREGLRGDFAESGTSWQGTSSDVERSVGADDREGAVPYTLKIRSGCEGGGKGALIQTNQSATLATNNDQYLFQPTCYGIDHAITTGGNCTAQDPCVYEDVEGTLKASGVHAVCYGISSYESNSMKSDNPHSGIYVADTSRTLDLNGGNPACNQGGIAVVESVGFDGYNATETGNKSATLGVNCGMSTGRNGVCIVDSVGGQAERCWEGNSAPCLRATHHKMPPCIVTLEPGIAAREGGHVYEDVSGTLRANAGDNQMAVAYGLDAYNQTLTDDKAKTLNSAASDADHVPCAVYSVENHPNDSRVKIDDEGKVQALTSRMGTGGGNVPMVMEEVPKVINLNKDDVQSKTILDPNGIAPALYAGECRGGGGECYVMEPFCKSRRAQTAEDATTWKHAKVANTLNTFDQGEARANEIIVMATQQGGAEICENLCPTITAAAGTSGNNQPVVALDRASFNQGQNAKYDFEINEEGVNSTLVARGPSAVAYGFDPGASRDVGVLFIEECGKTITNGTCPGHHDGVVIATTTGSYMQVEEDRSPTLMARDYKDPTCVEFFDATLRRYIVRRLTPTECARLQGFPDRWGHIEAKSDFTDEEYRFWLEVRNTHATITERAAKDYTKKQMLTWYNKLWTDGAEYKMWGNGIALPCALFVMEGIADVTNK